jgi:hypothetical protein
MASSILEEGCSFFRMAWIFPIHRGLQPAAVQRVRIEHRVRPSACYPFSLSSCGSVCSGSQYRHCFCRVNGNACESRPCGPCLLTRGCALFYDRLAPHRRGETIPYERGTLCSMTGKGNFFRPAIWMAEAVQSPGTRGRAVPYEQAWSRRGILEKALNF